LCWRRRCPLQVIFTNLSY